MNFAVETITTVTPAAIIGLVVAIAVLIVLVLKTKVHALLALIIAASIAALAAGMTPDAAVASITKGFGSTLATIGLVVGFGVMMGRILEVSGAAEKLAITMIRWLGNKREEWALSVAGYIISIPIFVDSAFVILTPLVKALATSTGRSRLTLGIAMAGGMVLTHHAVPPTPGPLGAAGIYGVSIGEMILYGVLLTVPALVTVTLYARFAGPRIEAMAPIPAAVASGGGGNILLVADGKTSAKEAFQEFNDLADERLKVLPSLFLSVLPILAPIVLIFLNTAISAVAKTTEDVVPALLVQIASFVGNPVIAVGLGVILAIYGLARQMDRNSVLAEMEKGVESAGIILLVTGAGGALGAVLRDSGVGDAIGAWVSTMPLPSILIPFLIATMVRLVQGSGTVAIITAASLSAPILAQIPDVNMILAAQAACLGAMVFSYFNDSLFWVVNRMLGVTDVKRQILTWSVPTTIAWATALVTILIADAFL
ncbi:GntP family permease [Arthrobacter sp. H14-L1]|uniref:GntP family permease n=1 Tax=Arthrobacter sp. H14-L1 TaxID=2996697 RepID=UPI00226FFD66|nr:gluconate:H+ symporter [Arthrobacter sp. H14-L1]MCY0906579.1 gluconate:H+ symporter [Arthrobacter sp. H14-L1]